MQVRSRDHKEKTFMSSANDVLAHSLSVSKGMLHRFVDDLSPQEFLHRPTPQANCVAWLIGHLTLSERSLLGRLGVPANRLPELPSGFEHRFSREEGCPQASEFGETSMLMPLFDKHRDLVIAQVRTADAKQLDTPLEKPFPPMFTTVMELAAFLSHHASMHAGQISMIRRSL